MKKNNPGAQRQVLARQTSLGISQSRRRRPIQSRTGLSSPAAFVRLKMQTQNSRFDLQKGTKFIHPSPALQSMHMELQSLPRSVRHAHLEGPTSTTIFKPPQQFLIRRDSEDGSCEGMYHDAIMSFCSSSNMPKHRHSHLRTPQLLRLQRTLPFDLDGIIPRTSPGRGNSASLPYSAY